MDMYNYLNSFDDFPERNDPKSLKQTLETVNAALGEQGEPQDMYSSLFSEDQSTVFPQTDDPHIVRDSSHESPIIDFFEDVDAVKIEEAADKLKPTLAKHATADMNDKKAANMLIDIEQRVKAFTAAVNDNNEQAKQSLKSWSGKVDAFITLLHGKSEIETVHHQAVVQYLITLKADMERVSFYNGDKNLDKKLKEMVRELEKALTNIPKPDKTRSYTMPQPMYSTEKYNTATAIVQLLLAIKYFVQYRLGLTQNLKVKNDMVFSQVQADDTSGRTQPNLK